MSIKQLQKFIDSKNIAKDLEPDEIARIATVVHHGYQNDINSRSAWEDQMQEAIDMTIQVDEVKNFPWPNASNVKYPLLTVACIQFWARAYGAIVQGDKVVKPRIFGQDPSGEKAKRGDRLSVHMNYQLTEQMTEWQPDTSKLLMGIPIMGCAFKKSYFSPLRRRPVSELVHAKYMIIDYEAKDIYSARLTQEFELYPNDIFERVQNGTFLDLELGRPSNADGDEDAPHKFLEQHWFIDLDDDGYKEPYIVTMHEETKQIIRIVARYDESGVLLKSGRMLITLAELNKEIAQRGGIKPADMGTVKMVRIEPIHYFTQYIFMPSPDGGIYGLGFGMLLTPIGKSINTTINQMLDAGTLSNQATGLIGKGLSLKKGVKDLTMGQWEQVESSGQDIRQQVYQLQFPGPSQVLFALLEFLVNAGSDIYSVKDIMLGDLPSNDTPATTTLAAIEQGQKLFSGIYKEIHFAQKEELKKIYMINRKHLDPTEYHNIVDAPDMDQEKTDYAGDPTDFTPVSDPSITSETQRYMKAQGLLQFLEDPWFHQGEIRKRYLEATGEDNVESLLKPQPDQPPPDPEMVKLQNQMAKDKADVMLKLQELQGKSLQMWSQAVLNIATAEAAEAGTQIDQYSQVIKGKELDMKAQQAQQAQQKQRAQQQGGQGGNQQG